MTKKTLAIILSTLTLTIFSMPVCAEETTDDAEYIAEQLGGEAISPDEVPEGVTPIEFDTVEEAKEFLEQQEQLQDNATIVEYGEEKAPGWYFRAATANTATKTATFSVTPLSSLKINATYTYANNKFTGVSSVTTSFTGYTSGTEWNQDTYSSTISSDGKKLSVTVYGHFDYYLLINTKLTKLGAKDEQYSASWNY